MKSKKQKMALISLGAAFGLTAGVALASFGTIMDVIGQGPKVQGGGPYVAYGWGGDAAKGEAASFVVERKGQRNGNSTDDGPALVVRENNNTPKLGAARFESRRGKPIETVGQGSSVFRNTKVRNTNGNKRGNVAITSVGAIRIQGKASSKSSDPLDSAEISLQGGVLEVKFANGKKVVLATDAL